MSSNSEALLLRRETVENQIQIILLVEVGATRSLKGRHRNPRTVWRRHEARGVAALCCTLVGSQSACCSEPGQVGMNLNFQFSASVTMGAA